MDRNHIRNLRCYFATWKTYITVCAWDKVDGNNRPYLSALVLTMGAIGSIGKVGNGLVLNLQSGRENACIGERRSTALDFGNQNRANPIVVNVEIRFNQILETVDPKRRNSGTNQRRVISMATKPTARSVEAALRERRNPEKAAFYPRFFKAGKGEYAEGDRFIGVVVPDQRKIAKQFKRLSLEEIQKLLNSPYHECRLTGILILVAHFENAKLDVQRRLIYDFYLSHLDRVNNWDLVDASAHKIVGEYLLNRSRRPLFGLAKANHLWKNRVAIIATLRFIQHDQLDTTIEISERMLDHPHDLIHKAVGWMLREVGKRNEKLLALFLDEHVSRMPRTMLRYSIEKLPERKRQHYLKH